MVPLRPPGLGRRWYLGLVAVCCLFASGLSWHFFVQPLNPLPDQSVSVQAALRYAQGLGFTNVVVDQDLAQPASAWLVLFPLGYPLLIGTMAKGGLAIDVAIKLVNALALVLGVLGWVRLGVGYLHRRSWQIVFCALLVLIGGSLVPLGGTADYIFWAGMPYWLHLIIRSHSEGGAQAKWSAVIGAAVIAAALISVRWAAAILVPAGCLILLCDALRNRSLTARTLVRLVVYGAVPTTLYIALVVINKSHSDAASTVLSFVKPEWQFDKLWYSYPLETLTTLPLGFDVLLRRLWRLAGPAEGSGLFRFAFTFLIPVAMLLAVVVARRRLRPILPWGALDNAVVIACLANIAFLAFMSVRYTWNNTNWSYLDEPRYFRPFLPAIALWWLCIIERGLLTKRILNAAALAVMAGVVFYLLQASVRWERAYLQAPDPHGELTARILALPETGRIKVVFDADISRYVVHERPRFLTFGYPDQAVTERLASSAPMDVWIVKRIREKDVYSLDPELHLKRVSALIHRFNAQKVWVSQDQSFEIYQARIDKKP